MSRQVAYLEAVQRAAHFIVQLRSIIYKIVLRVYNSDGNQVQLGPSPACMVLQLATIVQSEQCTY